jgi:dolichol-phosphate mannosyltransferase
MSSEDVTASVAVPLHRRVRLGLRVPANWLQLLRFGVVGGSGVVVNLAVFALAHGVAGLAYTAAAVAAWVVAVSNNFLLNRGWTFRARDGHAGFQGSRFFVVSFAAFAVQLGLLRLLVEGGAPAVAGQAAAIALATPINFVGNKLWSFRR